MMISNRNPWRNSFNIVLIAVIDMAFACLLVSIYLQKFLTPMQYPHPITNTTDIQRLPHPHPLKLFLLGPIIFNAFQIIMAYNLLAASKKRCEPIIAYAKAHTWFQFATVMFALLLIKLFLIMWFPPQGSMSRRDILGVTLIVFELAFKVFSLFIVKEFTDDLKWVLNTFPAPQYYCIYTSPIVPTAPVAPTTFSNIANPATTTGNNFQCSPPCPSFQFSQAPSNQNRNSAVITVA